MVPIDRWVATGLMFVGASAVGGCYVHENGMQTPTPTLHGRTAVAYAVPIPPIFGLPPVLHFPVEPESDEGLELHVPRKPDPPTFRTFDADGAEAAFRALDLSACKEEKKDSRGYADARVTFHPDGRVAHVDIEHFGWPTSVVACVSERISTVRIREYDGPGAVTVHTSLFLPFVDGQSSSSSLAGEAPRPRPLGRRDGGA